MKRNFIFLTLFLILVASFNPILAFAQEEEALETFVDEHEAFTFSYPADWAVVGAENGAVFIANSEEALEALQFGEDLVLEEGQFGMVMFFFPGDLLTMMGLDMETLTSDEAKPEERIQPVKDLFMPTPPDEENPPVFTEGIYLALDEETEDVVPMLPYTVEAEHVEGSIFFYEVGENVFTLGVAAAYTDEFSESEEALITILQSFEYTLSSEELFEVYMNGGFTNRVDDEPTEEPKH